MRLRWDRHVARRVRQRMNAKFGVEYLLEYIQLEDREGDEMIALILILVKQVVRIGGGWSWLMIMISGGF